MTSLRALAPAAFVALAACSSSNFTVAPSGGGDSGVAGDTSLDDASVSDEGLDQGTTADDTGVVPSDGIVPADLGVGDSIVPPPICNQPCGSGEVCVSGSCICQGTVCNGKCVDTNTDPLNCGGCNKAVCHGEVCVGGVPQCIGLLSPCGGVTGCLGCVAEQEDPNHCGGCDKKCALGFRCKAGNCTTDTCGTLLKECPAGSGTGVAGCTDPKIDPFNCGACGNVCKPTQYCSGGDCVDYTSAPGCNSCPCASCNTNGSDTSCCNYAKNTICSDGACPP